jgi:hypothetical protein
MTSSNDGAVSVAIGHLKLIREKASDGCFSTKRMQARWARDYYNGAWEQRQEELWDGAEGFNNEGGTSYIVRKCKSWSCDMYEFLTTESSQRIVEYLDSIRIAWEQIPRSLIGDADYAAADKLYDAYDSVRDDWIPPHSEIDNLHRLSTSIGLSGAESQKVFDRRVSPTGLVRRSVVSSLTTR